MRRRPAVLVVLVLSLAAVATGGPARPAEAVPEEDEDLSRIPPPPASPAPAAPPATGALQKIFLEDAFTQTWLQSALVPAPPPPDPRWEERALLDVRREWRAARDLRLTYSGRLNLRGQLRPLGKAVERSPL